MESFLMVALRDWTCDVFECSEILLCRIFLIVLDISYLPRARTYPGYKGSKASSPEGRLTPLTSSSFLSAIGLVVEYSLDKIRGRPERRDAITSRCIIYHHNRLLSSACMLSILNSVPSLWR